MTFLMKDDGILIFVMKSEAGWGGSGGEAKCTTWRWELGLGQVLKRAISKFRHCLKAASQNRYCKSMECWADTVDINIRDYLGRKDESAKGLRYQER